MNFRKKLKFEGRTEIEERAKKLVNNILNTI